MVVKGLILLRGTPKQVDFLRIEHPADECVAFLPVFGEPIWTDGTAGHKKVPISKFLTVCRRAQGRPATKFGGSQHGLKEVTFVFRKIMSGGQAARTIS